MKAVVSKRERVGLATEPACLRKISEKQKLGEPLKALVPVLCGTVIKDVRLCPPQSANRQKLYSVGDKVMVVHDYQKCEGPVWVFITHKNGKCKLYRRHIRDIDGTLSDVHEESVDCVITAKGQVGDNAKVGHNVVTLKRCYFVEFGNLGTSGIWFEAGMFSESDEEKSVREKEESGERNRQRPVLVLRPELCTWSFKACKKVSGKFADAGNHSDDAIIASFEEVKQEPAFLGLSPPQAQQSHVGLLPALPKLLGLVDEDEETILAEGTNEDKSQNNE